MLRQILLTAALTALAGGAQAGWQDAAAPGEAARLERLDEARTRALVEAQAGSDLALIHSVLDPVPVAASPRQFLGDWRCRTLRLGGMTPDVVYSWFRCRIAMHDGALTFVKISGTQKLEGELYPHDAGGLVLVGGWSAKGEPFHANSGDHPSYGAQATPDDAIGLLSLTGPGRARLELPFPVQESTLDVIELTR